MTLIDVISIRKTSSEVTGKVELNCLGNSNIFSPPIA